MHASSTKTMRFGPITVEYDARVLAPRAWTLLQSEWAAELSRELDARGESAPLLELCAGAGHIGLAAAVLADRDLVQVELDPVAAGYATDNARRAGWAERVEIRAVPLRSALDPDESFSLIVADPPYLRSAVTGQWPEDPLHAIDGGADGLELTRECLHLAAEHLAEGGSLLLQVAGAQQAADVDRILQTHQSWRLRTRELRSVDAERAVVRIDRR